MNFPNWFYFASSVLFRGKNIQDNTITYEQLNVTEPSYITAAAQYIAWIVDPTSESHRELLVEFFTEISESWVLKKCTEKRFKHQKSVGRKKLKKLKTHDGKDDHGLVQLWLEEFQNMYINYLRKTNSSCSQGITTQQNMLLRRIPLGIVIGYSHEIDEVESQLLLHYAVTGKLWNSQGLESSAKYFITNYNKNEAVAGANLVFNFTDIVDSMSRSLFDTEESGVDFICSVTLRTRKYLLSCVKRLLDTEKDDAAVMFRDICTRLGRWRLIGKGVFAMAKDFDDISDALSHRLSSS